MSFPSLPSSFLSLTNLQTLRLYQCNLSEIAIIRNLKKLDILSFQGSSIEQLPVEIAELTRLRLLDLSECYRLEVIPANVISKLSRLEELYVGNSFGQWNVEGNAQLPELKNLSCLSALHVDIPDAQIMPKDLFSVKLGRYKIAIGIFYWDFFECEASKVLQLKLDTGIHLDEGIKMLVEKTEELRIEEFKGAQNVLYELDREGFRHLKHLRVVNSSDMKCIIKSMGSAPHKAFPVLESLKLRSLTVIEKICDGQLKTESFSRLRTIQVEWCDRLKNLFSVSIAKNLDQLQKISVIDCKNMKEIVVDEEGKEDNVVWFRQLGSLELRDLRELKSFYSMEETPSLIGEGGSVSTTNMVPLFNGKVVFPAIKELVLGSLSSIGKLWDDQCPAAVMTSGFQNLSRLEVKSCHKLKDAFPSSIVKLFVQLNTLVVRGCEDMEEVKAVSAKEERNNIMVFPKLDSLHLWSLPNLKRFCCGINPIEFPVLRKLEIKDCPVMSTFHYDPSTSVGKNSSSISMDHNLQIDVPHCLFNDKVALPMLQKLSISSMKNLERLWPNQLAERSFSELSYFQLQDCVKLVNVFPLSMLTRLERLDQLIIRDCESVEEIFEPQQADVCTATATFEFPRLTSLELKRLPRLKSFHHKMYAKNWPSLKEMEFTFPTLQQLTLGWNEGMKEIWHCSAQQQQLLASHYFSKLKVVKLFDFPKQLAIFPSYLLQLLSFPNLETLEIMGAYFKEIFPSEGVGEEKPASAWVLLSRLTELRLKYLLELMHLWKETEGCSKLKNNLVPSTVSFKNLVTLEVYGLNGIIKVVAYSTAKSLVQLKEMKIWFCKNIEEIIQGSGDNEDEVKDEISFPQLNLLELVALPKLESFCSSGNYTFGFPSLVTVILEDCPKMKMFSQGDSNTPLLHKVWLQEWKNEERWEGNLNSTVQQLFKERNAMAREDEEYEDEILEEHQGNPTTSNTQNSMNTIEEVQNYIEDQGNPSNSNTQ